MSLRMFIHGLDSSNQGTKSIFFRERYPDMIIPNFTGNLQERMAQLEEILSDTSGIILVGSSFGGLMASIFAMQYESRVERLILLAPAINMIPKSPYVKRKISVPAHVYHGTHDEVIPLEDVEKEAKKLFQHLTFNMVDDDHFLHNTFKTIDWDMLL
jgi:pimeloyl-ACP methyl ester carboxylesterase